MAYLPDNLSELLEESQKGDKKAYEAFLLQIIPFIQSQVKKRVYLSQDQKDVSQNILLAIHKNLRTYTPGLPVGPWVKAIIHYKVVDYIREITRKWEKESHLFDSDITIPDSSTNKTKEELDFYLGLLPESLREPIILTKVWGKSTQEAAKEMGIEPSALRARVSRGLKKLKMELEKLDE